MTNHEIFSWTKHLPEDERTRFWEGLHEQLDCTRSSLSEPTWEDYEIEAEQLVAGWKATAQAHAAGLPETLATATEGDFGPVEPPYVPRYTRNSLITTAKQPGEPGPRYRVREVRNGHYLVRAPFSRTGWPEVFWWSAKDCDERTVLEWQLADPQVGVMDSSTLIPRQATAQELKDLGLTHG